MCINLRYTLNWYLKYYPKTGKKIFTANEYFILTFHRKDTNDSTLKDRIEVLYISSSRIHHKSKVRTKGVENWFSDRCSFLPSNAF